MIFKRKRNSPPAYWLDYAAKNRTSWPASTAVESLVFVVLDTETTGLNVKKDRILSIGAVKLANNSIEVGAGFECFLQQDALSETQAIAIHGLLPIARDDQLKEETALRLFLEYAGNAVLVGHHLGFDLAVINQALKKYTGGKLLNKFVDTGVLARRLEAKFPSVPAHPPTLDQLCHKYKVSQHDRHTAAGDAYITALLFLKLLSRLKERGVRTLGHLLRS